MTKYLILLGLLAVIGWLVYLRLRPYIQTARRIFGTVRDVRATLSEQETARAAAQTRPRTEKLERCAACGVWLPASRTLTAHASSDTIYCSRECLERSAVKGNQTRRATANKR